MSTRPQIGIFTADSDLIVRTWDDWLSTATLQSADQTVGRHLTDVIPDLDGRGLLQRVHGVLATGVVEVLAPALHRFLIPCPPREPSTEFDRMQQRVTIGPLRDGDAIVGVVFAIEDVTSRLQAERALAAALASNDWRNRHAAVEELSANADESFILALIDNVRRDHRNFSVLSSALKLMATTDVDVTAPLASLLRDPDADLRIQAALALGDQHRPEAVDALLMTLRDPDPNVRFQAIESLGRLRAEVAIDPLLAIVMSRDFFLSFAALDALTAIGDPRVAPDLVLLLTDDTLRVPVADALGALGDDRAIRPLIDVLNHTPKAAQSIADAIVRIYDRFEREYHDGARISDMVRHDVLDSGRAHLLRALENTSEEPLRAMVRMLGWLDGDDVNRRLAHLLSEPSVRSEVTEALVRHGEGVVELLLEQLRLADDDETRHAAIVALGRVGSRRATAALIEMFSESRELLVAAAGALARIGDPAAFEPLLSLLAHGDAAVRQAAIGALNSIGHPDLQARVVLLLDDAEPLIRESAVRIAGYFGYERAADRLIARVTDADESVRRAALEHLPYVDDPRVTSVLRSALAIDTAPARAAAVRGLGRVEDPAARDALMAALSDPDAWVRYYAARALAEQRHRDAVGLLVPRAVGDTAPQVRIAAIDALALLGDASVMEMMRDLTRDADRDVAAAALNALGHLSDANGLAELRDALRHDDSAMRLAAVAGLGANGSAEAVAALQWTAVTDHHAAVARAAVDALGTLAGRNAPGAEVAVLALVDMLADASRREMAASALMHLPPAAINTVGLGLEDPRPDVRRAVVDVLGRIQRPEASHFVTQSLKDAAATVRQAAITALTRLGGRVADASIADLAANDPSKAVRRAAAAALAQRRMIGSD